MTQRDAGAAVWPQSSPGSVQNKVARLESGDTGIALADLHRLLGVYGVTDGAVTDLAFFLQAAPSQRGRWSGYRAVYDDAARRYIDLEEDARLIRFVATEQVPGLLQSPSYLRAEFGTAVSPALRARQGRQQAVLFRENPADFYAVLSESCVRRVQGDHAVMREQIEHLLALSRQPHITIQIVPFASRPTPIAATGMLERFALLRLAAPGVLGELPEYLDYAFNRTGTELNWSDNVRRYEILWSQATGAALTPSETRSFLTTALRDFH
ncbi:transcriptional regulator [Amycolatopsis acidiphila]|nr:transcriptional regulator [Amycolatopsis acidiphila]